MFSNFFCYLRVFWQNKVVLTLEKRDQCPCSNVNQPVDFTAICWFQYNEDISFKIVHFIRSAVHEMDKHMEKIFQDSLQDF